ncbi:calcium-dependent protein kinase 3, putative [Plasmodium knowlesi strain H]|uniref:Calcium-dependent protein kinase 3, putative n=3 Tax=Plasmodium knowlesi TaxID=5850 RepID=A0A5K1VRZ1_PLAKH|nr:calcium-dependent protein kinase 3, putative [Plasmodium knowlesi strain H]OTN68617.1 putative Calcium-dependent protein kinase 3 [Plasmodium knowlesi]CAA9986114.1 calcium-dependent protein kinase 3, putative [Plasmodium knowlesi strain H]SBO25279.1 calcium-dependent protein kinase 3, putative [Plasmodium knowlesi strain H]SBO27610.1 calcium-dependent protein kinase 3, putative [Plasmodium knowlesi strain H]VVS75588.1 calcium-dependent protein kinase 3, putative [Plasmodium knowlesi strain |eukprot:XP_002257525.1 calcium-dependent protein kinase 3, putative [Plasmodium knowlesi strain H]
MKIHKCFMCNYFLKIVKGKRKRKKYTGSRNTLLRKGRAGEGDAVNGTHSNSTNSRSSFLEADPEEQVLPALEQTPSKEDIKASDNTTTVEPKADESCHFRCFPICNISCDHSFCLNGRCGNKVLEERTDTRGYIGRNTLRVNHHIDQRSRNLKKEAQYSCMLLHVCEGSRKSSPCHRTLIRRKDISANYSLDRHYLTFVAQYRIEKIKKNIMRVISFVRFFLSQRKNQRAINLIQQISKWEGGPLDVTPMWTELHHLYKREISRISRRKCIYNDPILETRKRRSRVLFIKLVKRSVGIVHMLEMEKIRQKRFVDRGNMGFFHRTKVIRIMENRIGRNKYIKNIIQLCQRYINLVDSSLLCIMNRMGKSVVRIGRTDKKCHGGTVITTDVTLHRRNNLNRVQTKGTVGKSKKGSQSFKGGHNGYRADKEDVPIVRESNVGTHFGEKSGGDPFSIGRIKSIREEKITRNSKSSNDMSADRNQQGAKPERGSMSTHSGTELTKWDRIYSTVELAYSLKSRTMRRSMCRAKQKVKWSIVCLKCKGKAPVKKMHSRKNNYKMCNLRKNRNHRGRRTKMWQSYFQENVKSEQTEEASEVEGETTLPEYDSHEEWVNSHKSFGVNSDNLMKGKRRTKEGSHGIYGYREKDPYWMVKKSETNKESYDTPKEEEKRIDHSDKEWDYRNRNKSAINRNDLNCVLHIGNKFVECLRSCEHIWKNFKMVKLIKDNCSNFVYKCFDTNNRRYVAIKSVNKEKQLSIMSYSTYLSIYRIVQKINNDNVVKIYDVLESPSHFFIVMELCEGTDLVEYVSKEEIPFEKAKDIISQLLNGINALHANSIIHRDIKLDNLMFKDKDFEKVVIIDFDMCVYMYGELDVSVGRGNYLYGSDTKEGLDENNLGSCDREEGATKVDVTNGNCTNRILTNPSFAQNSVHANSVQVNEALPKHSYNCEYITREDDAKGGGDVLRRSQFLTNNFYSNNTYINKFVRNNEERKNCIMYPPYSDSYIMVHRNSKRTASLNYNYISQIENGFLSACTDNTEKTFINEGDKVIWNDLIVGTKEYMSPYCLKGIYSIKTDIYSIGVTIFLILFKNFPYLFEGKSLSRWQNEVIKKNKDIVIPFSFLFHNVTCTYFVKLMDVHLMNNNIYFCKNSCLLDNNLKEIEKLQNIKIDFNQIRINAKNIYLIEILRRSLSLDLDDQYTSVSEILENKIFA